MNKPEDALVRVDALVPWLDPATGKQTEIHHIRWFSSVEAAFEYAEECNRKGKRVTYITTYSKGPSIEYPS